MGMRRQGIDNRVYCLLGDGELQEGQVWEAALTSAQHHLSNVCAIVDNNHVQLDGLTGEIKNMEPLVEKWQAFGWNVISVNGHDLKDLYRAFTKAMNEPNKPSVLIAQTIKGKGISFMENDCAWHGLAPNDDQFKQAMTELREGGNWI